MPKPTVTPDEGFFNSIYGIDRRLPTPTLTPRPRSFADDYVRSKPRNYGDAGAASLLTIIGLLKDILQGTPTAPPATPTPNRTKIHRDINRMF